MLWFLQLVNLYDKKQLNAKIVYHTAMPYFHLLCFSR